MKKNIPVIKQHGFPIEMFTPVQKHLGYNNNNNNNNNNQDNVYGAVTMAEPLREFTRFI